ncbi:hypothetical protein CLOSTMETH_02923 [[Clostridium] methylpentosum DSM 5476]|uniref:Uncharacterized protein n=1 Tax=[Clostridium] methylpentosum DSM 5476 TaxID=537013 RepID=C0EGD0_9FIRM|nr:hypothetical protein CLOSTMETH_02923 [[Clostridium] methylpentosum DSM 5476]MDY3990006.1 hypothetical protein [Massilioclostridium sp.]MEE1491608.1 hypothetical protein [Massilioclostridium sp.]
MSIFVHIPYPVLLTIIIAIDIVLVYHVISKKYNSKITQHQKIGIIMVALSTVFVAIHAASVKFEIIPFVQYFMLPIALLLIIVGVCIMRFSPYTKISSQENHITKILCILALIAIIVSIILIVCF